MIYRLSMLIIGMAWTWAAGADVFDGQKITFKVFDLKTNELFFTGDELITFAGESVKKVTRYYATNGKLAQLEECTYRKSDLRVLDYLFRNDQSGELTRMQVDPKGNVTIRYIERRGVKEVLNQKLSWGQSFGFGKTLYSGIVRRWAALMAGKEYVFDLLIPFKFDTYEFKIVKEGRKKVGKETLENMALKPTSWIVSQFVDDMNFYYRSGNPPLLIRYEGPTTIEVAGDRDKLVRIDFSYP